MSLTKRIPEIVGPMLALVLAGACGTLNIVDSNDPDRSRALSDPATVEAVGVGAFQNWYLTGQGGFGEDQNPSLTIAVMARSHTAMWNNFNIRFYTGCTNANWDVYTTATAGTCGPQTEGPYFPRIEWQNNPASAQRTQIEAYWYGYYASLSSANAVLNAIRKNGLVIQSASHTKMVEVMALLTQALDLSSLAMNYDQAFLVTDSTPLDANGSPIVTFSPAQVLRDTAASKFDQVIAAASANKFTVPGAFFGSPGIAYTNVSIGQIANTMAARNLAYFARNATDNAAVNWPRVAGYASKGISSGAAPFDLTFHQDGCNTWCDFLKVWTNDVTTMRIHTRVAHLLDPATQPDPWDVTVNKNPNSPDKRLGNGTFRGDSGYASSVLDAYPDTTNSGGTDYVWVIGQEFGNKTRGAWHQSAIGQVRYDSFPGCGDSPSGSLAPGVLDAPYMLAAENDLIWAEALIRGTPQDLTTAATLINKTRVGRGGLTPATAGDANLLAELLYEQDVELPGSNTAPFYNMRRIDKLEPNTPHVFPVPAKELGVLQLPLYTCGGAANPDGSCQAHAALVAALVTDAPRVWADMQRQAWERLHHYGLKASRPQ